MRPPEKSHGTILLLQGHIADTNPTDKQVRDLAFEYAPYAAEEAWAEEVAQSEPAPPAGQESSTTIGTDPTIAHAGLTEIDAVPEPSTEGTSHHVDTPSVPDASNIDAGAANAAGGTNWEAKQSAASGSAAEEWIEVPRDLAETETGNAATPAAMTSTQSWAEDVPTEPQMPTPAYGQTTPDSGDGFQAVQHRGGRGRGGGQGEYRSGNRGRGFKGDRGDSGGRGRGGTRGDRGGGDGGRGRGRGGGFRGGRGRGEGGQ